VGTTIFTVTQSSKVIGRGSEYRPAVGWLWWMMFRIETAREVGGKV